MMRLILSQRSSAVPCYRVGLGNARRSVRTAARLRLAYDIHEPPKSQTTPENAPILFLHGLFGSKKNNRAMSKALARDLGRYVYAVDLRNHGQSPHDKHHDYLAMADDVSNFIAYHGLQNTTLIGHSMSVPALNEGSKLRSVSPLTKAYLCFIRGAKTAMTLALRSPDDVADIVAVDNAPVDSLLGSDFSSYIRGMKKVDQSHVTRLAEADKILQEVENSLPIRQFLLGNLHREPGQNIQKFRIPLDTLGAALGHLGDFPFKDPSQVRFEKRALFVRGTKSKYVPDEVLPAVGQFFPKFRLIDIDAGHWVISEKPEEFRAAVVEFLQNQD